MNPLIRNIINFGFLIIIAIGITFIFFWRFGVLKSSNVEFSLEFEDAKNKIDYMTSFPASNLKFNDYLKNYNTNIIEISEIKSEELGRQFLF